MDCTTTERFPRVARSFMVRINTIPTAQEPRWDIVTTRNISASGMLFNYGHYLEPGSRVQFKISFPSCKNVNCEGEVVRNLTGSSSRFGNTEPAVCAVAVVFRDVAEQDQQVMSAFLEKSGASAVEQKQPVEKTESPTPQTPRAKRLERTFPLWIRKKGETAWEPVTMKNISSTGILVRSSKALEVGAGMALRLVLPFSKEPFTLWGAVVRVDRDALPNIFDVGVQLTVIAPALQQQMEEYAQKFGRD